MTSINGFGTAFVGEAMHGSDGSYVTTEWVIVALVPIIPLKTFRVVPDPRYDVRAVFVNATAYASAARVPLDVAQVARTYLFVLATCAWWLATFWTIGDPVKSSTPFEHSVLRDRRVDGGAPAAVGSAVGAA